jgi:hypothetical protein
VGIQRLKLQLLPEWTAVRLRWVPFVIAQRLISMLDELLIEDDQRECVSLSLPQALL